MTKSYIQSIYRAEELCREKGKEIPAWLRIRLFLIRFETEGK